jgi:hypothetical protein
MNRAYQLAGSPSVASNHCSCCLLAYCHTAFQHKQEVGMKRLCVFVCGRSVLQRWFLALSDMSEPIAGSDAAAELARLVTKQQG